MKATKIYFKCESCGKSFSIARSLRNHIYTVHEDHKDYKCDSCSNSFSSVGYLKAHIHTIHKGHKDYRCEWLNILKQFMKVIRIWITNATSTSSGLAVTASDNRFNEKKIIIKKNAKILGTWSAYIEWASASCTLTNAFPLLLDASTFGCVVSPLTRFALLQSTWRPRAPPSPPCWRQA